MVILFDLVSAIINILNLSVVNLVDKNWTIDYQILGFQLVE